MNVDRAAVSPDAPGESSIPMYQRIGGAAAVSVVDPLCALVGEDGLRRRCFERVDMARLRRHKAALLSQVLGGPRQHQGGILYEAYRTLDISGEHYERVGNYLLAAPLIAQVRPDAVNAVTEVVAAAASGPSSTGDDGPDTAAVWRPEAR
jgi:hemoglobin